MNTDVSLEELKEHEQDFNNCKYIMEIKRSFQILEAIKNVKKILKSQRLIDKFIDKSFIDFEYVINLAKATTCRDIADGSFLLNQKTGYMKVVSNLEESMIHIKLTRKDVDNIYGAYRFLIIEYDKMVSAIGKDEELSFEKFCEMKILRMAMCEIQTYRHPIMKIKLWISCLFR